MGDILSTLSEPVAASVVVGVLGTLVTAVITRLSWSSQAKRWTAIAVALLGTVIVFLATREPVGWQTVAQVIASVAGAAQIAYVALKPTGILGWLEAATTPGYQGRHEADDSEAGTSA